MLGAISKLLPLLTVAGGAAASSPNLKAQIAKVMETTKVVATQKEISDIAKMVYLDTLDGSHPKPEEFSNYLKNHMRTANGISRDTSMDQWGQRYLLRYDRRRSELIVTSAGPDMKYETADDIRGIYPLENTAGRY
ncbi:MAG: hypothetical protein RBT63_07245 [Bdellovibrionales bacterium]|jgi:hypothetical protein|nr:hypothetical protein [Bdellovibrionales bacterium]